MIFNSIKKERTVETALDQNFVVHDNEVSVTQCPY
jgi:hypothetical protein